MGTAINALAVIALLAVAGCSSSGGGGGQTAAPAGDANELSVGEQPVLSNGVVEFKQQDGQHLEAWEVVNEHNNTFLNYSRFPFGDTTYDNKPTYVCTTVDGGKKYVGVSEQPVHLKKALLVVAMQENSGKIPQAFSCQTFTDMTAAHPEFKSLTKIFDSLR
jgi:hypothetical protein